MMLKNLTIEDLGGGIEFVDIGASGGFPRAWESLVPHINYYAFEPNKEECERLTAEPNAFNNAHYFPFAVADTSGEATLYMTKDMQCYSLLEPNKPFLDRFEFAEKFEVMGTESLETVQLSEIPALADADVDIMKVDSQGLDQRILGNALNLLDRAFYVEVEPGFNQSYRTEDTYAEIDRFMRDHGFRLFDLTPHRIGRNNHFADIGAARGELLWAESVWIKDYVGLAQDGKVVDLSREKALKALLICAVEERLDFGFELATWFAGRKLITDEELTSLKNESAWAIGPTGGADAEAAAEKGLLSTCLRLLPRSLRSKLARSAQAALQQQHLFKR